MSLSAPDDDLTRDTDLINWQTFCLAYHEPIRRALRLLRVSDDAADELLQSFLLKAAEKNFLEKYRAFQRRERQEGRRAPFRTYLYRSLQNHVLDSLRPQVRRRETTLDPATTDRLEAQPAAQLDPDAIYALDVLHQALQALRHHCDRTGKAHLWVIFEELLLADEFLGRAGKSRDELLAGFPGREPQFLDNCLTTAKRAFRRLVQEVIPRGLRDDMSDDERFQDWMAILSRSNASQFNRLHVAYRVSPLLTADMSQAASMALVVDDARTPGRYEELSLLPSDDELSLLLSFRLEMPLSEMLEAPDLRAYIPIHHPFWPAPGAEAEAKPPRPLCLLTLVESSPEVVRSLDGIDLMGLLGRLKSMAKQLHRRPDHAMPEVFAQLLYTLVSVVALLRCDAELHTIGPASLAGNVRWFLGQTWLDDRLQPLFREGLARLDPCGAPQAAAAS